MAPPSPPGSSSLASAAAAASELADLALGSLGPYGRHKLIQATERAGSAVATSTSGRLFEALAVPDLVRVRRPPFASSSPPLPSAAPPALFLFHHPSTPMPGPRGQVAQMLADATARGQHAAHGDGGLLALLLGGRLARGALEVGRSPAGRAAFAAGARLGLEWCDEAMRPPPAAGGSGVSGISGVSGVSGTMLMCRMLLWQLVGPAHHRARRLHCVGRGLDAVAPVARRRHFLLRLPLQPFFPVFFRFFGLLFGIQFIVVVVVIPIVAAAAVVGNRACEAPGRWRWCLHCCFAKYPPTLVVFVIALMGAGRGGRNGSATRTRPRSNTYCTPGRARRARNARCFR